MKDSNPQGKEKEKVKEEKFNLGDELLDMHSKLVTESQVNNYSTISGKSQGLFDEKKRDDYMIRQAKIQLKGGATEKEVAKVLGLIAENAKPPFKEDEISYIVEKSIYDASQNDRNMSDDVKEFIESTEGYFSSTEIHKVLQVSTKKDLKNVSTILGRLCSEGLIARIGKKNGQFRKLNSSIEVIDWQNAEIDPLKVYIPMGLDKKAVVEKKSVILLAGVSNQGKSGFTLDFAKANKDVLPVRYFASEWSPSGLKSRLSKFKENMKVWEGIDFIDRNGDFADVIDPDGINIIDFLETHDDAWKASGEIKAMFDKLVTGICVINLQKNPGSTFGKGGHGTMEKPQIYLTIDDGYMTVQKIKQPPDDVMNITGLSRPYTYGPGGALIPDGSWGRLKKTIQRGVEVKELEVLGWANDVINWDEKMG
jgi:hypothetical protein